MCCKKNLVDFIKILENFLDIKFVRGIDANKLDRQAKYI